MRIGLVNPPLHYYMRMRYSYVATVGLPILAALLEQAGHEVEVVDAEALCWVPDRVAAYGATYGWEAAGVSALTMSRRGAAETVAALRQRIPGLYIVAGGVHPTIYPDEALGWGADCVMTGEADGNVAEVFGQQPRGVVAGVPPVDLDVLPEPAWHLLALKTVNRYPGMTPPYPPPDACMLASRGCPHRCVFCGDTIFGGRLWRPRSPERIADEIEHLRQRWGINSIFIYDDEMIGMSDRQSVWMRDVCRAIIGRGLHHGIHLRTQGRCSVKHVDLETLTLMRQAGFRMVMWGVESFSQTVLDAVRKGTSPEMILHTLRTARQAGLDNFVFLMVGNLEETPAEAEKTVAGLRQCLDEGLVQFRQVTITSPQPATELWRRAEAEGWLVEQPAVGAAMHEVYGATPWMTVQQQQHYQQVLEAMR